MRAGGALQLEGVGLRIGRRMLVQPIDLVVPPGTIATVMGPSGSGKSSLLAYICGTLDPALDGFGRVLVDGQEITTLAPERRRIGILFQDDLLFPHLDVGENLSFGLPRDLTRAERRQRVAAALAAADLTGFATRRPESLSGGQRARVALLRTLMSEPMALLLDEPFNKLDADLRARFRQWVFAEASRRALPALLVTHDASDAAAAGGSILMLA
ncbi:MAG: ATP-binding cassette domain-containing protein [Dongiaceae bacterium]